MLSSIVHLAPPERRELKRRIRARAARAEDARRAEVILRLAQGQSYSSIRGALRCGQSYISRWKQRFERERLAGLYSRHRGRVPEKNSAALQARILDYTRRSPGDGSTHWTTRKLAKELGLNHMRVARAWRSAGLRPHRMRRYLQSEDPFFEQKAAQIIALYLNPPAHAAVFCVDEKSAIQALDRLDPVLPLSPGRAERHGFEYYRHGTLSLFAALELGSGRVIGKTAPRHTSAEFVAFLEQLLAHQPSGREIHIIADNLSSHKTKRVEEFLTRHPHVTFHFTPTYSSWLNQIELWFSKLERDVIARGIFKSRLDLKRKILRYLRRYNKDAKPFKWSYRTPSHRIKVSSTLNVTVH
jgi:transposase